MGIRTRETTEYFPKVKKSKQTTSTTVAASKSKVKVTVGKNKKSAPGKKSASATKSKKGKVKVSLEKEGKAAKENCNERQTQSQVQEELPPPLLPLPSTVVLTDVNGASSTSNIAGGSTTSTLKNGILKANKKMKNGMRMMMERTNKILERSRNCKKSKKSPLKPRILPARASARLCVRKNSGEHEQATTCTDRPLRTVELIKRPLELRDPATKLLYMASLALYPKADPESDTTPIVIISEEIPNPGGKRPKLRSMELPLMPNWRNFHFHSTNRAPIVPEPVLLRIAPLQSSNNSPNNGPSRPEKPSKKRKATGKKSQSSTPNSSLPSTPDLNQSNDENKQNANPTNGRSKIKASNSKSLPTSEVKETTEKMEIQYNSEGQLSKPTKSTVKKPKAPRVSNGSKASKKVESKISNHSPITESNEHPNLTITEATKSEQKIPLDLHTNLAPQTSLSFTAIKPNPTTTVVSSSFSYNSTPSTSCSFSSTPLSSRAMNINVSQNSARDLGPTFTSYSNIPFSGVTFSPFTTVSSVSVPPLSLVSGGSLTVSPSITVPTNTVDFNVPKKVNTAFVKNKRKSLETIIKGIPKAKGQKLDLNLSVPQPTALPITLPEGSQSSNPILEGLMKNPVKKRTLKSKVEAQQMQIPNITTTTSYQNPISMTVPLQPAPGLQNVGMVVKESKQPRSKKQKSQFQLPVPLPIPIPPGLLNYASLMTKTDVPPSTKPKKQRKPKVKKPAEFVNPPQPTVPRVPEQSNHYPSIPYLPSHLEAFFKPLPLPVMNGTAGSPPVFSDQSQALDLCVKVKAKKAAPKKRQKKAKLSAPNKSLLKPLNIEEDIPLNLVVNRQVPIVKKVEELQPLSVTEAVKQQGNLENVKQMLARLHTRIAPAVNGVQLITIE